MAAVGTEHLSQSQNRRDVRGAGGATGCSPGPGEGSFLLPSHSCHLRQLAKEPITANYLVTEPLPPGVFSSKNKEFVNLNEFPVGGMCRGRLSTLLCAPLSPPLPPLPGCPPKVPIRTGPGPPEQPLSPVPFQGSGRAGLRKDTGECARWLDDFLVARDHSHSTQLQFLLAFCIQKRIQLAANTKV